MAEGAAQSSREQWLGARPVLEKLGLGRRFSTLQAWLWASATVREYPWPRFSFLYRYYLWLLM
jgi:hypothetical protein